jgi:hypothetical protein
MQPGLSRAIPAGILGFLGGALLALIIRGLQGLTPTWEVGPGMVLGSFISAGFFVWGMGGFDPRMSVHGEGHEEEAHEEEPKPTELLGGTIWQLTTLLIGFVLILVAFAWIPGGPRLTITADPAASTVGIGYFDLNLFGIQIPQVSELVIFIAFFIIMMLSLFVLAGALGAGFHSLARGVANAQAVQHTPMERQLFELPSGLPATETASATAARPRFSEPVANILFFAILVVGFFVIYSLIMPIVINNILGDVLVILDDTRFFFSIAGALALAAGIARPPNILTPAAVFLAIAALLYPIFYHVAIGLVIASPEIVRVIASAVNALLIPLLLLRPKFVTFVVGRGARIAANVLRWVGTVK